MHDKNSCIHMRKYHHYVLCDKFYYTSNLMRWILHNECFSLASLNLKSQPLKIRESRTLKYCFSSIFFLLDSKIT